MFPGLMFGSTFWLNWEPIVSRNRCLYTKYVIISSGMAALRTARSPATFVMPSSFPPEFLCTFCYSWNRLSVFVATSKSCLNRAVNCSSVGSSLLSMNVR